MKEINTKRNRYIFTLFSRIYFWVESYDVFNYSVPPITSLFYIFQFIGCLFPLFLRIFGYFSNNNFAYMSEIGGNKMILYFYLTIFLITTIMTIVLQANDGKNYKKMETYAGKDFLQHLDEKGEKRPFLLYFFVLVNLLFTPIFISVFSILSLCSYQ